MWNTSVSTRQQYFWNRLVLHLSLRYWHISSTTYWIALSRTSFLSQCCPKPCLHFFLELLQKQLQLKLRKHLPESNHHCCLKKVLTWCTQTRQKSLGDWLTCKKIYKREQRKEYKISALAVRLDVISVKLSTQRQIFVLFLNSEIIKDYITKLPPMASTFCATVIHRNSP